jgi:hypothetical protein
MIKLAPILRDHQTEFLRIYGHRLHSPHHRALEHILACHTPACGEILSHCGTCQRDSVHYTSSGNRFCPSCQYLPILTG